MLSLPGSYDSDLRSPMVEPAERRGEGIDTHQFSVSGNTAQILGTLRERGSKMNFICLHAGRDVKNIVANTQPIAMAHHGGATDALFRERKSREVHDFVKDRPRLRDSGGRVGSQPRLYQEGNCLTGT